jgi:Glycine rich protein
MGTHFRRGGLRVGLLGFLAGGLLLTTAVGSSAAADPPAGCTTTAGVATCVFAYTGATQTWTVPAGVTSATFDVLGAQGGAYSPPAGGQGGEATGVLTLTPGDTVTLLVGGQGATGGGFAVDSAGGQGGFNGGGNGGIGFFAGAGGGGASDVRIGGSGLADRMLVAGGGGGASNAGCSTGQNADGGAGGGLTGNAGLGACPGFNTFGSGGDQTGASGSGQLGTGSQGADFGFITAGGGGGGGGYYGGGGGGQNTAGGGGSGHLDPSATGASMHTGVRSGDGLITITYTKCTPTGFYRDGINLTARLVEPASTVSGTLDASGCNIGVYYGPGTTGTVSGADVSGANYFGVVANAASVNVSNSSVHDIGETQPNGSQHGVGVIYTTVDPGGLTGTSASGTLSGSTVTHYQKNGVVVSGSGAAATVKSNTVTGYGMIDYIAQNGIEVASGATASVTGNTVSGDWYTPKSFVACGLLFFQAGGVKQSGNSLFNNEVNLCNAGRGGGNYKP